MQCFFRWLKQVDTGSWLDLLVLLGILPFSKEGAEKNPEIKFG